MMDINDVKKLIDNVAQKPFLCSNTEITTDNGYVITTKEHYEKLRKHRLCRARGREAGTKFCTPDYSIVNGETSNTKENSNTVTGGKYMFEPETVQLGSTGTSVLLLQEILVARGFKGRNSKVLDLDREAGDNTIYALKAYQKSRNGALEVDGVCGPATWKDLVAI